MRHAFGLFVLLGAGAFFAASCSREAPAPALESKPTGLAADERIAWLLASRTHPEPFLSDTSDLIPALISKLASGKSDALGQAKVDLAAMGERALPALRSFFDACYSDEALSARMMNALDTATMMKDGIGRPLLVRGLDHPVGSVRLSALRGLGKQARPEDFDRLKIVAAVTGSEGHVQLAEALWCADKDRVVRELASWINGSMPAQVILPLGQNLERYEDKAALLALKPLLDVVSTEFRARLLGALAHAGDEQCLDELRLMLTDTVAPRRELAAKVLHDGGMQHELVKSLREDGYIPVRLVAVQALSEIPFENDVREALESAAGDPAEQVKAMALAALVKAGDAAGENEALALLKGDRADLERALIVLRDPMTERKELAERVLAVLEGLRTGSIGPLRVERSSIWRAISQVPLESAARILFDEMAHQPSPDKHFSAHRWFLMQIGNTGEAGWKLVREAWKTEADPERRMDLLNTSCYDRGEDGRVFLEQALDSARMTPLEILYAAQQLASMGPAERVAPRLKRLALEIRDKDVRPAFNNLLWNWYGLEP
ncbi:MAG: HEAT repeat domain-containing protein [Planctomycetes bacterium]|nr:HEAT repeat domain-containing protein [Planctomycetota bacterium]